jgi:hypothetical protein
MLIAQTILAATAFSRRLYWERFHWVEASGWFLFEHESTAELTIKKIVLTRPRADLRSIVLVPSCS